MEKIIWSDLEANEILHRVEEESNVLHTITGVNA